MIHWMKRRIQRSRARCHKALLAHRPTEQRPEAEHKQEHESKAAFRTGSHPKQNK
ncbi:MAG TPA: hypothetical protein VF658_13075 [Pyrinomonadaceae bacterium]|jgi:hypothetical protein